MGDAGCRHGLLFEACYECRLTALTASRDALPPCDPHCMCDVIPGFCCRCERRRSDIGEAVLAEQEGRWKAVEIAVPLVDQLRAAVAARDRYVIAFRRVQGALTDAASVGVPDEPEQAEEAVRELTIERDAARGEAGRYREALILIRMQSHFASLAYQLADSAIETSPADERKGAHQ